MGPTFGTLLETSAQVPLWYNGCLGPMDPFSEKTGLANGNGSPTLAYTHITCDCEITIALN